MNDRTIAVYDIGGTKTTVAVLQGREIVAKHTFPSDNGDFYQHLRRCSDVLLQIRGDLRPEALGVNVPGMADPDRGVLLYAPFAGWRNLPVIEPLREMTGIDVVAVENDVNACAVGEGYFGCDDCQNYLWLTVSTGCGGGLVVDGKVLAGSAFCAGEIGHVKVEYDHPRLCPCGQYGCLEAHASGTAMGKQLQEAALQDSILANRIGDKPFTAQTLCELAYAGDNTALTIVEQCATWLGRGIAAACNLVNPQKVYIGGGVSRSLDLFLPTMQKVLKANAIGNCANAEICATALGYEAAVYGAAAVAAGKLK